ncbi:Crp/Fnr family transcriptional regulator [Eubacterium sp. 1001713B170207_170306_E7]|uniref:Crp/Fnr family transcriptional regulator n=1 Tax=Eubacterium sp. 1001713B170207_170306_E7 TaxID=2787097 RepID=UPI00189B63E1|nr:Crp/Fnr family transcriptional regulator [Eubacterium sp. 1001713B170207_170306_E7]
MDERIAGIFEGVCENTLKHLTASENLRCYRKGEHLFRDREATPFVFVILSGKASLYKIGESGQKKVAFILGPGELINEDIHPETTSSVSCEAFENLEVLCVEKDRLKEWMKMDFALTEIVLDAANRKIRRLYRQLKNTTGVLKMERRVAAKLWKLANDYGVDTPYGRTIDMNISITYLADLMGSPRETISRALKLLKTQRLIRQDKSRITVVNMDALSDYFKQ